MAAALAPLLARLLAGGAGAAGSAGTTATAASGGTAASGTAATGASGQAAGAAGSAAGSASGQAAGMASQAMQIEQLQSVMQQGQGVAQGAMQAFSFGSSNQETRNPFTAAMNQLVKPNQASVMQDARNLRKESVGVAKGMVMGGPIANVKSWQKLSEIMLTLPMRMERWSETLLQSQQHLMKYNATIASTFIERERRGIVRDIQSAGTTAGTTQRLGESLDDLKDELQPWRDSFTNVGQLVVTELVKISTGLVRVGPKLSPALDALARINQYLELIYGKLDEDNRAPFFHQLSKELAEADSKPNSPVNSRRVRRGP